MSSKFGHKVRAASTWVTLPDGVAEQSILLLVKRKPARHEDEGGAQAGGPLWAYHFGCHVQKSTHDALISKEGLTLRILLLVVTQQVSFRMLCGNVVKGEKTF